MHAAEQRFAFSRFCRVIFGCIGSRANSDVLLWLAATRRYLLQHLSRLIIPDVYQMVSQHGAEGFLFLLHRHLRIRPAWHVAVDTPGRGCGSGLPHNSAITRLVAFEAALNEELRISTLLMMWIMTRCALHIGALLKTLAKCHSSLLIG